MRETKKEREDFCLFFLYECVDCLVLPGIGMREPGPKEAMILSLGVHWWMVGISVLWFVQCFVTVGLVTGRTSGL